MNKRLLIAVVLLGLMTLSFFETPLLGDEIFVLFQLGSFFAYNPETIFSKSIEASVGGWRSGRFISPLTHLLSNTGVFITYKFADFFGVDLLTSYNSMRIVLKFVIVLSLIYAVKLLLPVKLNVALKNNLLLILIVASAATMITNSAWSATRISIWSYDLTVLIYIILIYSVGLIASIEFKRLTGFKANLIRASLLVIGILFASTYELTQILFPSAVIYFVAVHHNYATHRSNSETKGYLKQLKSTYSYLASLAVGFFTVFFIIFFRNQYVCNQVGCYQTADIKLQGFSFFNLFGRLYSHLPFVSINIGLSSNPSWFDFNIYKIFLLISIPVLLYLIFTYIVNPIFRQVYKINPSGIKPLRHSSFYLLAFALVILLSISFGMSMSRAIQESGSPFVQTSNRDTLIMNLAYGIFIFGIFVLSLTINYRKKSYLRHLKLPFIWSVIFSFLYTFAFLSNLLVTKDSQISYLHYYNKRFANELAYPDFTPDGDIVRCNFISQKLKNNPEWLGHDLSLVNGLNYTFLKKYKNEFCSISIDSLFAEYVEPS